MLRIRTVRGTHVRITLQVVATKTTLLGKGTKRSRVVHAIVLYQQGLRGLCGWPWACHGAPARIGYKPGQAGAGASCCERGDHAGQCPADGLRDDPTLASHVRAA